MSERCGGKMGDEKLVDRVAKCVWEWGDTLGPWRQALNNGRYDEDTALDVREARKVARRIIRKVRGTGVGRG